MKGVVDRVAQRLITCSTFASKLVTALRRWIDLEFSVFCKANELV